MGFEQLIIMAKDWGPTAITTIIAFAISHLLKQQNKNATEDAERSKQFKESLANGLKRIEEKQNETIDEIKKELERHRNEIEVLKLDKLEKDEFYNSLGGWRAEINRLQDLIINQNNSTLEKIITIWQENKK